LRADPDTPGPPKGGTTNNGPRWSGQCEWVRQKLSVPQSELLQDLRLLLADGSQVRGADVYRFVMRRIWWAYPLAGRR
jgi:hypothetical protein